MDRSGSEAVSPPGDASCPQRDAKQTLRCMSATGSSQPQKPIPITQKREACFILIGCEEHCGAHYNRRDP